MSSIDPAAIPNRFEFAETQARIYHEWESRGFFHAEPPKAGEADATKGPYAIVIPPPNVTGALHLGHALNNTLQDIQIRMHRMMGYNALWMPGTDHAGIATQAVVERRLREEEKLTRHDLGREKLVERIWEWKAQYETRILSQLKQMGCSCDWERTRFTLDDVCARAVRQTFFDLFSKGLIYRGKRLVNWDTFLQTAVSDDEVFQETVKGKFWHFKYPVVTLARRASEGKPASTTNPVVRGSPDPAHNEPEFVEIATTRPETMLGDTAVAVHPDPAAALDKAEAELRERLEKAPAKEKEAIQTQIDNIAERRKTMLPLLITLRDMAKAGRKLMLPLLNREIPLVCDEWAKPELGTGAVKITPAHDPNDYEVGKRQSLPMINILNPDGTLNDAAGPYKGLTIHKARERVVADLDKLGLLGDVEDREIELPHSDRSKTPIEPYLADQWFVKMSDIEDTLARRASEGKASSTPASAKLQPGLAQTAMDAVTSGRVNILPPRYAKSYLDWLGEKRDWPVSRQLWWGHQIPVWTVTINLESKWVHTTSGLNRPTPHGIVAGEIGKLFSELENKTGQEQVCADPSIPKDTSRRERAAGVGNDLPSTLQFCTLSHDADEIMQRLASELEQKNQGKMVLSKFQLATEYVTKIERDQDVLDTWFSSALWPHSTLGWPVADAELSSDNLATLESAIHRKAALKYWYPTSVLITSRDIITLWVARMVLTGLNNMGEIPFREVFIHPKILDGYGETMSKSKGNGVDPLDIIEKFGTDSLRFGLTALTTETQDVRMPVQFECPHCQALIDQTKKNRELPRA